MEDDYLNQSSIEESTPGEIQAKNFMSSEKKKEIKSRLFDEQNSFL